MPYLCDHDQEQKVRALLALEKKACGVKKDVLDSYEAVSRWITRMAPDRFGDDTIFAATEWLLHAHACGHLDWTDLATVLERRVGYWHLFAYLGGEPCDYEGDFENPKTKRWWKKSHRRERYVRQLAARPMRGNFITTFAWVAGYLRKRGLKKTNVTRTDILAGRSAEYLLHVCRPGEIRDVCELGGTQHYSKHGIPDARGNPKDPRAEAFEDELLADGEFCDDLSAVGRAVAAKHAHRLWWTFRVDEEGNGCFDAQWMSRPVGLPSWKLVPAQKEDMKGGKPVFDPGVDLKAFCSKWCLQEISYSKWEDHRSQGMKIVARRVRIWREKNGVRVFIPRYYSFNDLRRSEEFTALRRAMDASYGNLVVRKTRAAKIARAKRYRRALISEGMSRPDAWEKTKEFMKWKGGTMQRYLGERPSGKIARMGRLPKNTVLPTKAPNGDSQAMQ